MVWLIAFTLYIMEYVNQQNKVKSKFGRIFETWPTTFFGAYCMKI